MMTGRSDISWPAVALAAATAVAMLVAGVSFWLVLGVLLLWTGSLWLARPAPASHEAQVRERRSTAVRDVMAGVIEPLAVPVILFDRERIMAANDAARRALGRHIVGQDARIALRHPEAIRLLDLPDRGSVTIAGLTGGRSLWQLTRQRIDERFWAIELHDRTAEADMGRAHTDFVANASHELRTPIAAIIGYVETLVDARDTIEPETMERFHGTVLREAKRMQSLVADLMSLSQLEAEKHDAPTDRLELGQVAARVVGEFTATIGNARLRIERPDEAIPVNGDSKQLEQLVRNLVDNALKYGEPDKPVVVSLVPGKGEVELAVSDGGPGIPPEHLPHLTRRFYRTDPGRSRQAGGTGLGLAIVKHIVERHRARLDIVSQPGEGTRVSVRFAMAGETDAGVS